MATSIVGTFPILNLKKSQTDEYGFDYVSYVYTIKTSTLSSYNIKKDDIFTSIETWRGISWSANPNSSSNYVVDSVESKNTAGGLTELSINTVGSKNSAELNPPKVSIITAGPLIYGLSGTKPNPAPYYFGSYGTSGNGQSVEIKFIANGGADGQRAILTTFIGTAMPSTFRGIALPAPAGGNISGAVFTSYYAGFVGKTVLTEKRGSLLLVTVVFSEAGRLSIKSGSGAGTVFATAYNYPIVG